MANGAEPPLRIGIWYLADAPTTHYPLGAYTQTVAAGSEVQGRALTWVVMSHDGGGS